MIFWLSFYCLVLCVSGLVVSSDEASDEISDEIENEYDDYCKKIDCVGEEYRCVEGRCYCAPGYLPNYFQERCVKCPVLDMWVGTAKITGTWRQYDFGHIGIGEKCRGKCCSSNVNETLQCWQGICQPCHNSYGNWICRDNFKDILLISSAQIAMGAALVLGIVATFVLLYKICAATSIGPLGERPNGARLSVGSLQLYIDERLRDAPPRYTRAPAPDSSIYPPIVYLNHGFVHDSSVPPPPYTREIKTEDRRHSNSTLHI